jgi:hypothetical protein
MGEKIYVRCARMDKLRGVPLERRPDLPWIGAEPVEVTRTLYYQRQIDCGDLEVVAAPSPKKEA